MATGPDIRISGDGRFRSVAGRFAAMGTQARRFRAIGVYALAHEIKEITDATLEIETPEVSGDLKRKTRAIVRPSAAGAIITWESTSPYAGFVIHGTGIYAGHSEYDIVATAGRALYWAGAAHPVRSVHWVGNRPNNYPVRAVDRALPAQLAACRRVGTVVWFTGSRP